nr:hypothetical protein [Tanacetum cinerariifolium]
MKEQRFSSLLMTSALPHDSTPRVTSLDADEGSMQQQLQELMDLCTRLQRQQTKMATKTEAQDLEISSLKARIKLLEDKDKGGVKLFGDDAPIKGRSMEIGDEAGVEKSTERESNDTEELVNVLTFIDAKNILISGVQAISVPLVAKVFTVSVPTGSGLVPTKMVESDTPKKKKLQEQIDVQVAREMEEEMAREDQRSSCKDTKVSGLTKQATLQEGTNGILYVSPQKPFWMENQTFQRERIKKKGLKLEQGSAKRMKTSENEFEEDIKEMMQLVPVEEVYVEALQVKHPIIDWEIHFEGQRDYWKIIRLGGHTSSLPILCRHAKAV